MQFNMFEAGAVNTPPKKPVNPSIGYPSNGDLSHGKAPTQLGAYWVYQLSEEFTALLKDNGIEPNPDDLHQLSKFFKSYKSAMSEIKAVAVEAGSGAKSVLADMRQTQKEMIALKAGTADDLRQTRDDLASTRNALSEVNSVLSDARTYTQKFNQYQSDLDSHKGQIQSLLTSNTSLEGRIKNDLSEIAKKQTAISSMESHVVQVKGQVDDINSSLTSKASDVARALSSVNATERQMQTQLSQANTAAEAVQGVKKEVEALKAEAVGTVDTVRSLSKQAADAVQAGLTSVQSVADGVARDKSETKSYRDQAQSAAQKASASAELAKNVQWSDVKNKPSAFPPATHTHSLADVNSLKETISDLTQKVDGVGEVVKQNLPKAYITESWRDGDSWYRIWSDGWMELGGAQNLSSKQETITVMLYKPVNLIAIFAQVYEYSTERDYFANDPLRCLSPRYARIDWHLSVPSKFKLSPTKYDGSLLNLTKEPVKFYWNISGFINKEEQ